jgi:hypothetical protein
MTRRSFGFAMSIFCVTIAPAMGQWSNVQTRGIPRTGEGKVDMTAATPRTSQGKPDLSGIWEADRGKEVANEDLSAGFKNDFPIQPWAEELAKNRQARAAADIPTASCLPAGIPLLTISSAAYPLKIVQQPDLIVILYEWFGEVRQVFLDGRSVPANPNPTWLGYSTARWDRDTLVVETTGFNGKAWLDAAGHPATEDLRITERYQRRDVGHLDVTLTIDDVKAYTRAWAVTLHLHLLPDTELLEFVCNENERDLRHRN